MGADRGRALKGHSRTLAHATVPLGGPSYVRLKSCAGSIPAASIGLAKRCRAAGYAGLAGVSSAAWAAATFSRRAFVSSCTKI